MPETAFSPKSLAWANLSRRPFRAAGLAAIVALFTFILFGGLVLNQNLSRGLDSLSGRLGADLLIVPYGYEKETQAALLRGEPSTFYLKAGLLDKVRQAPGVRAATPQFFLASLAASCCTAKVQIIGFDPDSDFLVRPWTESRRAELGRGRVVAGSRIITEVGGEVSFFGVTYTVAAKMEPTGMGFDTSVFMPLDDVYALMKNSGLAEGDLEQVDGFISSIAVKTDPAYQIREVGNELMRLYAIDYNLDLVLTKNLISDLSVRLKSLSAIVWVLAAILWVLALLIMSLVFSTALNERKRELSLLRILGAPVPGWAA